MDQASKLFSEGQRLRFEIDEILAKPSSSISVQQRLSLLLRDFAVIVEKFKSAVGPSPQGVWESRLRKMTEDLAEGESASKKILNGFFTKEEQERDYREKLFGELRENKTGENPEREYLRERKALDDSHNMMDGLIAQGRAAYDNIYDQNNILKTAKGKMFDLLNAAGVSSTLAKAIGGRERVDAFIVYGCMFIVILLIIILWWFR